MIDHYTWYTPNGRKTAIFLEEAGLKHKTHLIDIGRGDQFEPEFLKISPNHRIPAIVDPDGPGGEPLALFESGAILIYLAEKTGKFLPADGASRYDVIQWVMFQMGGVGPMFGQFNHFNRYAREKIPYALDRYRKECGRLYWVMENQLRDRDFIAGDYSIADMALYPWACNFDMRDQDPDEIPHVKAWADRIASRPAVQRAMATLERKTEPGPIDDEIWENMYGDSQYRRR